MKVGANAFERGCVPCPDGCLSISPQFGQPVWLKDVAVRSDVGCALRFEACSKADIIVLLCNGVDDAMQIGPDAGEQFNECTRRALYEVVFGSHCNTKTIIRKRGVEKAARKVGHRREKAQQPKTPWHFQTFWVALRNGVIAMGLGNAVGHRRLLEWKDENSESCDMFGVSCWDQSVVFKKIRVSPLLDGVLVSHDSNPCCRGITSAFDSFLREGTLVDTEIYTRGSIEAASTVASSAHAIFLASWSDALRARFVGSACAQKLTPQSDRSFREAGARYRIQLGTESRAACAATIELLYGREILIDSPQLANQIRSVLFELDPEFHVAHRFHTWCERNRRSLENGSALRVSIAILSITASEADESNATRSASHRASALIDKMLYYRTATIFESGDLCDVSVHLECLEYGNVMERTALRAHRALLASQNEYFHALLTGVMVESRQNDISLPSNSASAARIVLKALYSGAKAAPQYDELDGICVENVSFCSDLAFAESMSLLTSASVDELLDIVRLGDFLAFTPLLQPACLELTKRLTPECAPAVLLLAATLGVHELFQESCRFVAEHASTVFAKTNQALGVLNVAEVVSVLSRDDLRIADESAVIEYVFHWATHALCALFDDRDSDAGNEHNKPYAAISGTSSHREQFHDAVDDFCFALACVRRSFLSQERVDARLTSLDASYEESKVSRLSELARLILEDENDDDCFQTEKSSHGDPGAYYEMVDERPSSTAGAMCSSHGGLSSIQCVRVLPYQWVPPVFRAESEDAFYSNSSSNRRKCVFERSARARPEPQRDKILSLISSRPRIGSHNDLSIPYVAHSERNGVIDCLAHRACLPGQWMNPVQQGVICVSSSSLSPAQFAADRVVARLGISAANRCTQLVPGKSGFAWVALDIGPRFSLACHHYVLMHDNSTDHFLRSWVFEADVSDDSKGARAGGRRSLDMTEAHVDARAEIDGSWEILSTHVDDRSLQSSLQTCVWRTNPAQHGRFHRCFRIRSLEHGALVKLGGIELYGTLREQSCG